MFEEFKNKYLGKSVDVDRSFGPQCVDLFNAFNRDYNNCYINCKPTGYARSIAENKNHNGILNYYHETSINNMIEGTVIVYGKCAFAKEGHVCFFIKDNGNGTYQALQQNADGRQYVTIDNNPYTGIIGAFIPNQVQEEFNRNLSEQATFKKSINEIAQEVIQGIWGNGEDRKNRLTQAGYNYRSVQNRVNEILINRVSKQQLKSVDVVAKEVIQGIWGNGEDRKKSLTNAGYNYSEIQNKVNELLNNKQ